MYDLYRKAASTIRDSATVKDSDTDMDMLCNEKVLTEHLVVVEMCG